jgi:periplasmic protein TonB
LTSSSRLGAALAVALHLAVLAALLAYEPARSALLAAAPIMVNLIAPPVPEAPPKPPEPRIEPPKPKPKPVARKIPKPVKPPPVVSAPVEAPSPIVVAPPPPAPPAPPEPVFAPPPLPVTQPIFNADYLDNPPPRYPALSRRIGEQGRVVLRVLVNPGGTAEEVQVRTSSGHPRLDASARETVRGWKFAPARQGTEPIAAWVLIPISFKLEG